jgi:glycerol-3-phosphate acyltransferase PlsY
MVAVAYALGCIPSAELVGRRRGFDPRGQGSGNPGATNALRLGGRGAGASVLAADLLKGFLPTALAGWVTAPSVAAAVGAAAVLGHLAPVTRGGRGGKGVATTAGVALALAPWAAAIAAVAFVLVAAATRLVSAASVLAAVVLPAAAALRSEEPASVAGLGVLALVVVARHRGNLVRIRRGTEPRLGGASIIEEPTCSERFARP